MKHGEGFTTGSCAAAAAKAAAYMLLTGDRINEVDIIVPRGDVFKAELCNVMSTDKSVRCAVQKNGGDDPDITTGMMIYAEVSYSTRNTIHISGGKGIGRVTRPGLDQPVGEAAINSVPRQMILSAVQEVCDEAGYEGGLDIVVSAPGGEEIAKRTFNPRLGIEGGISIIGTSGVVEPMSEKALKDAIYVELKQRRALGETGIVISPGNYGRQFLLEYYGYDIDRAVKCSNFIGDTMDMCVELGFTDVILAGHTGKLVKVASGIMNTHSHEADARMETIAAAGIRAGIPLETLNEILDSVSTTEAFQKIQKYDEANPGLNTLDCVMSTIIGRIQSYLEFRTAKRINIETTIYCGDIALLSESSHMRSALERIVKKQEKRII
ncbi:MAG: cobalamin biosynthesis protein CbiD [Lachnospiraceae bacterium]|nr:cobalamin biosynthesis protein CbiD [Lachnospiraceae bacterium]